MNIFVSIDDVRSQLLAGQRWLLAEFSEPTPLGGKQYEANIIICAEWQLSGKPSHPTLLGVLESALQCVHEPH